MLSHNPDHNGEERQVALARLGDLAARKYPHAVSIQQQAHHHLGVQRRRPTGFMLIGGIATAQVQMGHRIEQEKHQIAFRQLGLRAMGRIPVVLGGPGPRRFPTGIAHDQSPYVGVTKGVITGRRYYHLSCHQAQLSATQLRLSRTAS